MVQITLSEDQARKVQAANGDPIVVVDANGKVLGYVRRPAFTEEEVAEAVQRADAGGPWYTTEEVLAHLSKLEK